jgi:hypothetical protein
MLGQLQESCFPGVKKLLGRGNVLSKTVETGKILLVVGKVPTSQEGWLA